MRSQNRESIHALVVIGPIEQLQVVKICQDQPIESNGSPNRWDQLQLLSCFHGVARCCHGLQLAGFVRGDLGAPGRSWRQRPRVATARGDATASPRGSHSTEEVEEVGKSAEGREEVLRKAQRSAKRSAKSRSVGRFHRTSHKKIQDD